MTLNQQRMREAYPQTPDVVRIRMEQTLAGIRREAAKQPPWRYARRLSFAVTMALVTVLAVGAVAAGAHFGVFDFMKKMFGASGVLPEAEELVQQNLGSLKLEHTTLNVDEAVYDGGTLHVVYSITQNDADVPLTEQDAEDSQSAFQLAVAADAVHMECDSFWVNGTEYCMTNCSTVDTMIGENDGELLCYLDIQLASAGIVPDGDFTVKLPVAGGNGDYQTLDFTVQASGSDWQPVVLYSDNATVTLTSAFVSPVRIYATLRLEMNADASAQEADETFEDWAEAELVDAQGNRLAGMTELMPENLVDGESVDYSYTFLPTEAEEVYLAPTFINEQGEWAVDMTRALPLQ